MKLIKSFWADESGQGLTEYAVIIALVAAGAARRLNESTDPQA